MIKCEKCETENENGSKFCKSCGSSLQVEPVQTASSVNNNAMISTVKKIAMWTIIAIVAFITVVILINFVQAKKEDSQVRELRNACANNDAQACYELGVLNYFGSGVFHSEKTVDFDEGHEALAKGCQLGNANACHAGGYYKEGCNLRNGKSCYEYAKTLDSILVREYEKAKQYYQLSCQYGYSQGCMENR